MVNQEDYWDALYHEKTRFNGIYISFFRKSIQRKEASRTYGS